MAQWAPSKKGEGGKSLYGSMLRQVKLAGGRVKGLLWYQGEAEANPDGAKAYPKVFADFIAAVRADFGQPDMPFYLVQLGRFVKAIDPKPWNAVQETQRLIPERIANTAVISVVDLELDDGIHIGTQGLKRAGVRLARIALHDQYGQVGGATPTLDRVYWGGDRTLVVKFKDVNLGPVASSVGSNHLAGLPNAPASLLGIKPTDASSNLVGLQPARHVSGFSIRKEDGGEIPLIYKAYVSPAKHSVILRLTENPPKGANLWYGWGLDPACNLTDAFDMAVPVFGPVHLDEIH